MIDIMIDIETLDNKDSAAIMSIAAASFDMETGAVYGTLQVNVDTQDCIDLGMTVNYETLHWWLAIPEQVEVMKSFTENMLPLQDALLKLHKFIGVYGKDNVNVWGNSNRFDLGILANAYNRLNLRLPWRFWLERDVRTLVWLAPQFKEVELEQRPTTHDPLEDVLAQIRYVVATYKHLKYGRQ